MLFFLLFKTGVKVRLNHWCCLINKSQKQPIAGNKPAKAFTVLDMYQTGAKIVTEK
jgi:hypothetical protein